MFLTAAQNVRFWHKADMTVAPHFQPASLTRYDPFPGLGGAMRRREFIALLSSVTAVWPVAALAQQPTGNRRLGVLLNLSENDVEAQRLLKAFREGLAQLGWIDGRNLRIDYRWAGGLQCTMPVADITLDPKSIDRVRQACTNLINSPGGSADARSLAFIQRGSMYRRQQKYELALADFDQAIRYDPKSASGYTGRGNALRLLGRLDESIAAHSEAIRLEPNNAMAYSNRGNALGDKKDYEHAIADFDMAIKIDPKYATAFYNRADVKLTAGDKSGAIADYRQALTLRPGFKEAADMLKQLGAK
jgi:tetratricopeptide (TPR) repeat protein